MLALKYSTLVFLILIGLVMLFFYLKSGKPLKWMLINALLGAGSFFVVFILKQFASISLPLNEISTAAFSVLGAPAVCGMLLLPLIF